MKKLNYNKIENITGGDAAPSLQCAIGTGGSVLLGSLAGPWGAIAGGLVGAAVFC